MVIYKLGQCILNFIDRRKLYKECIPNKYWLIRGHYLIDEQLLEIKIKQQDFMLNTSAMDNHFIIRLSFKRIQRQSFRV